MSLDGDWRWFIEESIPREDGKCVFESEKYGVCVGLFLKGKDRECIDYNHMILPLIFECIEVIIDVSQSIHPQKETYKPNCSSSY